MQQEIDWSNMTAAEVGALADEETIVILPVASTEQHGPHLPTGCDAILTAEIARRVALKVREQRAVLVAPTVWVGLARHHVAFGGTFSISFATYHALLRDVVRSIRDAGFSRILIVNGHGGNIAALSVLTDELAHELGVRLAATTYPMLASHAGDIEPILEDQAQLQHACEAETSMMLAIRPELVREDKLAEAHQPGYVKGDSSPLSDPITVWTSFKDFAPSGVRGDARRATAEKGEKLFEVAARHIADKLIAGEPWSR